MIKFRQKTLLVGLESAYGVEEVLTAANAVLAKDIELMPLESNPIDRGLVKPFVGANEKIITGEHVSINFKVELQGSGSAGTAPAFAPLLLAAGFAETITPATDVSYDLVSEDEQSATFYFYIGDNLHKATGARGSVKLEMDGGITYLAFNYLALYVAPTTDAQPTADWSAWQKPTPTGEGRTLGFSLQGYAAKPHKLELDVGQTVEYIETLTTKEVMITDRAGSGSTTIEAPALSDKNYFDSILANTLGSLTIQHGTDAGKICKVTAPNVQLEAPKYGDENGIATLELSLTLVPTAAGNDEINFTFE